MSATTAKPEFDEQAILGERRGQPRKSAQRRRTSNLTVCLTPTERAVINALAEARGIRPAELLRERALSPELREVIEAAIRYDEQRAKED